MKQLKLASALMAAVAASLGRFSGGTSINLSPTNGPAKRIPSSKKRKNSHKTKERGVGKRGKTYSFVGTCPVNSNRYGIFRCRQTGELETLYFSIKR